MNFESTSSLGSPNTVNGHSRQSINVVSNASSADDSHFQTVSVYLYSFNPVSYEDRISFDFHKWATTEELIEKVLQQKQGRFPEVISKIRMRRNDSKLISGFLINKN